MRFPGFKFDYAVKDSRFKGILKINDEMRFISRWQLLRIAAWFIWRAIHPRRVNTPYRGSHEMWKSETYKKLDELEIKYKDEPW